MTRDTYSECHGMEHEMPGGGEPRCTLCGRDLFNEERVFTVDDESGHDIICMDCLKKMSIGELAELFGAVLTKVRNLV